MVGGIGAVKLYLAYWVLQHGAPADKARVENMIRFSEDGTATNWPMTSGIACG